LENDLDVEVKADVKTFFISNALLGYIPSIYESSVHLRIGESISMGV
jgi:hypothetical protein